MAEEARNIRDALLQQMTSLDVDEEVNAIDLSVTNPTSFDFSLLVSLRQAHETKQAATCTRTQLASSTTPTILEGSQRQAIIREFHQISREASEKHPLTGVSRDIHWKGSTLDTKITSGNAQNADQAATVQGKRVCLFSFAKSS